MVSKESHFDFEWWVIQKRAVYTTAMVLGLSAIVGGASLYVWKYGNPLKSIAARADSPAGARFMSFEGDVRVVRAATRQVVFANNDIQLYPGDTVQTQADGRARIGMADGSTVVVRPNSTIIIRDNASAEDGKRSNVHVVVDSGQMLVRTEQQSEDNRNVIETPKTQNQITGQTQASFGVNPEGTEEIRVNSGRVDSSNRAGERLSVQGGEYVSVNQSGTLSKPQRLLDVPQPLQPHDLEKIPASSNASASVVLRWQKPQSGMVSYYRVEVATSPFFVPSGKVIERDQLTVTQFEVRDLRPSVYNNVTDVPVANLSAVHLGGNVYIIRGISSPGVTLRVAGREATAASDGSFQIQVSAPPSTREVTVLASDSQGNSSQYRVSLIRAN